MKALHIKTLLLILIGIGGFSIAAHAVRVANLYAAEVPLEGGSSGLQRAFGAAFAQVLVKATGRPEIVTTGSVAARFGDPSRFVQQYRIDSEDQVWVQFDEVALRRELDRIGETVWGSERPTTLVWLLLDEGSGRREILRGAPEGAARLAPVDASDPDAEPSEILREALLAAADTRGLPLILPLVDMQEMQSISLSDVWGGFSESLIDASGRYDADAILIGRARVASGTSASVRWTLVLDRDRFDWSGDVASGPNETADVFAARLSTSVGPSSMVILSVDAVDSLDDYGRLSAYLAGLDLVEDFAVDRVNDQQVIFHLAVRGDADRLMQSIALQRVLQPVDEMLAPPVVDPVGGSPSAQNLHYRLMAGP